MEGVGAPDRQAEELVKLGVFSSIGEAAEAVESSRRRRMAADIALFYTDYKLVRSAFEGELVSEELYALSDVRKAMVRSGVLVKAKKYNLGVKPPWKRLALGGLMELVPKDMQSARIAAWVRDFPYEHRGSIFLSPWDADDVRARGGKTFDDRHGAYRIEFRPLRGDYILGMFDAWEKHTIAEEAALALWIPKSKILQYPLTTNPGE
jgi:hypothetical protein